MTMQIVSPQILRLESLDMLLGNARALEFESHLELEVYYQHYGF